MLQYFMKDLLFLFQSVKILTYREPQNPEYKDFVTDLKANAKKMFNFTVEDSLVGYNRFTTGSLSTKIYQ